MLSQTTNAVQEQIAVTWMKLLPDALYVLSSTVSIVVAASHNSVLAFSKSGQPLWNTVIEQPATTLHLFT